jgi:hypothetical protein
MAATYRLLVDWLDNGLGDSADDVTLRTLDQRTPLAVRYGRDQIRQLSPSAPGSLAFELNNTSRDYSPENTGSPLAGFVAAGRRVQLEATSGDTVKVVYTGYLDDFDVKPGINDRSVPVTCIDSLGRLKGITVTTPLYQGVRTGDAIGYLLDAVGWPDGQRDLDPGASFLPYWWLDGADAYDALMQLVDSEGPAALVTVDTQNRMVFRDRHHRLTRSASLTVQSTWRSVGNEPCVSDPVTYDHGWRDVVNSVSVDVPVRQADSLLSQVWTSQGLTVVPAGGSITITAGASGPFLGAVSPEQDTDYTLLSGDVAFSLSRTSGQSTVLTLTSVSGATIQDLALRAYALQASTVSVLVEDAVSIGRYGRKSYPGGRLPVWANVYDAYAILSLIVAQRAERLPTIAVTMRGAGGPDRLAECLGRDLSDRIHLTETLTGLDADCYIEQIAHSIGQGGLEHVTTFGMEKIPPVVTNPFTFNTAGRGFDQGVFQGGGIDDPSTMFRFDTSGHGFGQGVFVN